MAASKIAKGASSIINSRRGMDSTSHEVNLVAVVRATHDSALDLPSNWGHAPNHAR